MTTNPGHPHTASAGVWLLNSLENENVFLMEG